LTVVSVRQSRIQRLAIKNNNRHILLQVPAAVQKTINILMVGETGVGKTTFINNFANCLTYETLEEAMRHNHKILALIPCSFTQADRFHERHVVTIGEVDANENNEVGQSATQICKSYLFPFGELVIRIMDTPGIGDVRGIEQDKINLENILAFISQPHLKELHGICILLKSNDSRLTVNFNYCLKELLCHLQKDAARNIMFVFTNTRGTSYLPGETYAILKKRLDEIRAVPPHVDISLDRDRIFCFDSEAFRYLMIHKQGIQMQPGSARIFSKSWKISVQVF